MVVANPIAVSGMTNKKAILFILIAGALLLVVTPEMANDPEISQHLDAAISYVGGRADTLFSGVYVRDNIPGLIAIMLMGGLEQ